MRALTIKQPWAWSIIHAKRKRKDIENRTWNTSFRGTFAVHAAKSMIPDAEFPKGASRPLDDDLELGAIIGVVDLVEVVEEHASPWFGGPVGFVLANPRPLKKPIPIKGKLSFWNVPDNIAKKIKAEMGGGFEEGVMGAVSKKTAPRKATKRKSAGRSTKRPSKKEEAKARKKVRSTINEGFFRKNVRKIKETDLKTVLENAEKIIRKFTDKTSLEPYVDDAILLVSLVSDYSTGKYREVPFWTIAAVVFALLYVLSPVDLIPDAIPVIGYLDDAAVVDLCISLIQRELNAYREWKERNPR